MAYDDDSSASSVLVAFLFGALTGAGIALLLAPRSGRETREALGEKLKNTADRGRALGERALAKGREAANAASRAAERDRDRLDRS